MMAAPNAWNRSPITFAVIAACILIFGVQIVVGDDLMGAFALWPIGRGFQVWQPLSCAFLHGGVMHLGTNMFGLWMFGRSVEQALGSSRFLELFVLSVLTAALTQLAVTYPLSETVPTIGASGGLFGVLGAFAWLFPRRIIVLLIPPIPLPAPIFVACYAALELYSGITGTQSGIAHFAHLGGLVGGFLVLWQWRATLRRER